jgi:uncharacterized membrane protein YeaQ/YmgE (transglycosylase-associated protein family)
MDTIMWVLTLVVLGVATGWIVGALLAFTQGRAIYDLAAGLLGALIAAVPLRLAGLPGYSAALPTLLVGVGAAMLATWLTRIVAWPAQPAPRPADDFSKARDAQPSRDFWTTSDGPRLLLRAGRLVVPGLSDAATQPTGPA